jgi:hypothetical protein
MIWMWDAEGWGIGLAERLIVTFSFKELVKSHCIELRSSFPLEGSSPKSARTSMYRIG